MNSIVLSGRLVKDIEIKEFGATKIVNNTLAVTRDKNVTDFIDVRFFGKTAEILQEYAKKGTQLICNGSLRIDVYKDKEDKTKKAIYVCVARCEIVNAVVDNEEHKQMKQEQAALNELGIDEEDMPF